MSRYLSLSSKTAAIAGAGALALLALGAPAGAADSGDDSTIGEVDVSVTIEASSVPGALTLSVPGDAVVLTEDGSTGLYRQFTGHLPDVWVTDTRDPASLPDGAGWTVVGHASNFGDIPARNFGWTPYNGADVGQWPTRPGDVVEPGYPDTGEDQDVVGLSWPHTLLASPDAKATAGGSWNAGAQLMLRTSPTQPAGTYTGTITLSLFE